MVVFFSFIKLAALLSYLVLALLTLRSQAERAVRTYFSIYLFGMMFWQFTSFMVNMAHDAATALFWYNLLLAGSGAFNILFYPFTRALVRITRQKWLLILAYVSCAILLASGLLGLQFHRVVFGKGGYWVPVFSNRWLYVLAALSYFFWFNGLANLIRGLRTHRSPVERNRIRYVLLGAMLVIVGATSDLTVLRDYPVDISANLGSALIIGYAVVRFRLMEIRVVLLRSLFYSILTAALIAAYLGVVFGLENLLKVGIGYAGPFYGIAAIFALAVVFLPLRNLFQQLLDRLFFRERADYQKVTQSFSHDINSLYDLDEILEFVVHTVGDTTKASGVSVALLDESEGGYVVAKNSGRSTVSGYLVSQHSSLVLRLIREGNPILREEARLNPHSRSLIEQNPSLFETGDVAVVVPILSKDRLIGLLNVGTKLSGSMYNQVDIRFLTTIANQTTTAIEKSFVYLEIQRRLSEQTLLFVLSEKFRTTMDFDSIMASVVDVLKSFLSCEYCALVYFDTEGDSKTYATDRISEVAGENLTGIRAQFPPSVSELQRSLRDRGDLSEAERETIGSLRYLPLEGSDGTVGALIISERISVGLADAREIELLRTIRAIISQGISLYRTIAHLVSVKNYNENILNSLNDMGDMLVILDLEGHIKSANRAICERLGYAESELVGQHMKLIAGQETSLFSEQGIRRLVEKGSISSYELHYQSKGGDSVPMLFSGSVMGGDGGRSREIVGIGRDITEHLKAEEMAKNLLVVQEIHHRIKNNLQVISSLLFLQSGYVPDEKTRGMFKESQNRVRSMALLHEKLYRSENPAGADFAEYIGDLTGNLLRSYGPSAAMVSLAVDISGISLGMDTATPCGLIVNELVSNSIKHAFSSDRPGEIRIGMTPVQGPSDEYAENGDGRKWYELVVSDNGRGFPEGVDFRKTDSLGLQIVCTLTTQMRGQIELDRSNGTKFTLRFKEQ